MNHIGLKKGVLTVVEVVKPTVNNKYTVVKCLCSKCGEYSEVRLDRLTIKAPYAEHFCTHCRESYYLEEAKKKFVGKKNGVLECINVVQRHQDNNYRNYRTMAVCRCSVCGSITEVRAHRLFEEGKYTPQSCSNCVNEIYRKTTKQRYYNLYQCEGEEYEIKRHDAERVLKLKQGAKERNLVFELSDDKAKELLHQECYYCGQPNANGIDRVDSTKDYTVDNCVPCCTICNIMKNKFSSETFFNHIKMIYNKHFKTITA